MIRLQKYLASAGVCSRRAAEELIRAGRVSVDGVAVTELGTKVDPACQAVAVDGKTVRTPGAENVYILLHKPPGVLTTVRDPFGRETVMGLLSEELGRLFPVGRLDQDSEGLLLLTNDGEITFRLLHPSHKVRKTYLVTVQTRPSRADLDLLRAGVDIEGRKTLPCAIKVLGTTKRSTVLEVTIREGRKRQIRLMFDHVGHRVVRLLRTRMGPLTLGDLPPGRWRRLTEREVQALKEAVGLGEPPACPSPRRPRRNPSSYKGGRED